MSHRTKNRMKPKTANPCMASSSRAMAVRGGCRDWRSQRVGIESTSWTTSEWDQSEEQGVRVWRAWLVKAEDSASSWQRGTSGTSPCQELRGHGYRDQPRPGGAYVRVTVQAARVCQSPDRPTVSWLTVGSSGTWRWVATASTPLPDNFKIKVLFIYLFSKKTVSGCWLH